MKKILYLTLGCIIGLNGLFSQPIIYQDNATLVTGTWNQNGTLTEVTGSTPYEGIQHYAFTYSYSQYWSGIGLNFNNWGSGSTVDMSAYTHLRLAYRGMSGVQRLQVNINSSSGSGNASEVGNPVGDYTVIDIPLFAFKAGTSLDLTAVTDLYISVTGSDPNGSGILYFDQIELVNLSNNVNTSAATWTRFNTMQRGMNLSNWLEAYWLIPFNAFPDEDKYTEQTMIDFRNIGIDVFRLPVTFENLAGMTTPYTLATNHPAISLLDQAIQWSANQGVKLIIDMHHGADLTDTNFQTELPRLEAIWEQLMQRYGDLDPERYFFEIYNEPHAISNANFRTVAEALINVIRTNETGVHSIIVGATGYNSISSLLSFTPLTDPDVMYTFHFYDPYFFTHQQMSWTSTSIPARAFPINTDVADVTSLINAGGEWRDFYNVPLFAGEFGVSQQANQQDRCNWITTVVDLFDDHGFPWFYWGALDLSDGFGFFANASISEMDMDACFGSAMGLPAAVLPVTNISPLAMKCDGASTQLSWSLFSDERASLWVEGFDARSQRWRSHGEHSVQLGQKEYTQTITGSHYDYFRLKVQEVDGLVTYTDATLNPCRGERFWKVFPNPACAGQVFLEAATADNVRIQLYSNTGQLMRSWTNIQVTSGIAHRLTLPTLPAGVYWLRVHSRTGAVDWERLLVE
ncbi:MAG: cellulase family glycosylhydrolase [Bacteroidota bacterium]